MRLVWHVVWVYAALAALAHMPATCSAPTIALMTYFAFPLATGVLIADANSDYGDVVSSLEAFVAMLVIDGAVRSFAPPCDGVASTA